MGGGAAAGAVAVGAAAGAAVASNVCVLILYVGRPRFERFAHSRKEQK